MPLPRLQLRVPREPEGSARALMLVLVMVMLLLLMLMMLMVMVLVFQSGQRRRRRRRGGELDRVWTARANQTVVERKVQHRRRRYQR